MLKTCEITLIQASGLFFSNAGQQYILYTNAFEMCVQKKINIPRLHCSQFTSLRHSATHRTCTRGSNNSNQEDSYINLGVTYSHCVNAQEQQNTSAVEESPVKSSTAQPHVYPPIYMCRGITLFLNSTVQCTMWKMLYWFSETFFCSFTNSLPVFVTFTEKGFFCGHRCHRNKEKLYS